MDAKPSDCRHILACSGDTARKPHRISARTTVRLSAAERGAAQAYTGTDSVYSSVAASLGICSSCARSPPPGRCVGLPSVRGSTARGRCGPARSRSPLKPGNSVQGLLAAARAGPCAAMPGGTSSDADRGRPPSEGLLEGDRTRREHRRCRSRHQSTHRHSSVSCYPIADGKNLISSGAEHTTYALVHRWQRRLHALVGRPIA